MRSAAFNTGPDFHLLDHIAPLAHLLNIPLITTEELNTTLAHKYYPQVTVEFKPDLEFCLQEIADRFDSIYECKYWLPHLKETFKWLYKKNMELVFCPHGQSDKGYQGPTLAPYVHQDRVLIYGNLMIEMLKDLNLWDQIQSHTLIGNYREIFYHQNKSFYDQQAEDEIFSHLNKNNKTLLYAPTWKDQDQGTSFFEYGAKVIKELPSDWNLIVKLHPLLEQRNPAQFYIITKWIEEKPNAVLVHEFPPVYPILNKVDCYLGDFSSIGYDFLAFQKPMYFFPSKHKVRLQSCGIILNPEKPIYQQIVLNNPFEKIQKTLYSHAFTLGIPLLNGWQNKKSLQII